LKPTAVALDSGLAGTAALRDSGQHRPGGVFRQLTVRANADAQHVVSQCGDLHDAAPERISIPFDGLPGKR
jgi:hypothetical protein